MDTVITITPEDLSSVLYARRHLARHWTFIARSHTRAWVGPDRTGVTVDYFHGEVRLSLGGRRRVTLTAQGEKQWTATEVIALLISYGVLEAK